MNSHTNENISLSTEEKQILLTLTVPVPSNEIKRIELLRQSKLLDENAAETSFSRFTSLASRLFDMPYAAVSFVEVDRIHFKSKIGYEFEQYHRNEWFDAYTILPDSSEVYVIPDCSVDGRFKERPYVKNYPNIQFYAGAAIMIDNYKIGVLSIMDTKPHKFFSLEDKENLLDLGAAAAQLAKEKLQKALNLSAERANIVVSMMHHLRTPMTSLNFATSLLCNDIQKMNIDSQVEKLQEEHAYFQKNQSVSDHSSNQGIGESKGQDNMNNNNTPNNNGINGINNNNANANVNTNGNGNNSSTAFQAFESSFNEINMALNQLNILVDSSLSLGQAIIKCSNQNDTFPNLLSNQRPSHTPNVMKMNNNQNDGTENNNTNNNNNQNNQNNNRFSECNILDYLTDMFHHHLPVHNNQLEVEWIVDTTDLNRGSHVTFPDAIMLIVISSISHMGSESNSLGFHFSFSPIDEDDYEYPELIHKMIEGKLSIKIYAKDTGYHPHLTPSLPSNNTNTNANNNNNNNTIANNSISSNNQIDKQQLNTMLIANGFMNFGTGYDTNNLTSLSIDSQDTTTDLLTKQNFLSIDKILRAINGRSRECIEDISAWSYYLENPSKLPYYCTIHEFLVPCKILLHGNSLTTINSGKPYHSPNANPNATANATNTTSSSSPPPQEAQRLHFLRPAILPPHRNNQNKHGIHQHTTSGINPGGIGGGSFILERTVSIPTMNNFASNNSPLKQQPSSSLQQQQSTYDKNNYNNTNNNNNTNIIANHNPNHVMKKVGDNNTTGNTNTNPTTATIPEIPPKPLKILVVEDTIPVQKLLTRWLQNHGCIVTCANNGKIGLDLLMNNVYDIAFVDFLMPVMLGITTMKLYQDWSKSSNTPPEKQHIIHGNHNLLIVGMSATALESEQEEAFLYGMHFFCPKPVSLELLAIILDAKREFELNDDAVTKICIITGTNQLEEEEEQDGMNGGGIGEEDDNGNLSGSNRPPTESESGIYLVNGNSGSMHGGIQEEKNNLINDGTNNNNNNNTTAVNGGAGSKEESKNKWALFRSHKQVRKIYPDGTTEQDGK